jgi:NADH-quinone oxidoreductase subunit H
MAYMTYAERRIIGSIQLRKGPNRVGPLGLLQPITDAIKLMAKQGFTPKEASSFLYHIAPVLSFSSAMIVWTFLPIGIQGSSIQTDLSLLCVFTITSLGVYGILLAGWGSNSKYALIGALRSVAQVLSYELAMSLIFLSIMTASGSSNLQVIIDNQSGGVQCWYGVRYFPIFILYLICGFAETNRAPFDIAEGESELVAGYHVEYGAWGFALFFLAEYINMIVVSVIAAILFLGGASAPFGFWEIEQLSFMWLILKTALLLYLFIWTRATLPRYRYDQLIKLGWTALIPAAILGLCVISAIECLPGALQL